MQNSDNRSFLQLFAPDLDNYNFSAFPILIRIEIRATQFSEIKLELPNSRKLEIKLKSELKLHQAEIKADRNLFR